MRAKRVVGNWKMHGSLGRNAELLGECARRLGGQDRPVGVEVAVCVPFPYLAQTQAALAGTALAWGAQDVSAHAQGAYTGEVAAPMLAEFGARYVIVGHSERRAWHGETSALVAAKAAAALAAGLTPIVCVGESLEERESGMTETVVGGQLSVCIETLGLDLLARCVVAYEPVWAIGTGRNATPEQAQAVHAFLRRRLGKAGDVVSVLYGGSVKPSNAAALFAMPDVDGGLIGGAALSIEDFEPVCRACA